MPPIENTRRHDLDVLRVLACYLLFLFHVGMVFNPAPFFHVRNAEVSIVFLVLCGFISLWHMPLFFLLAGWSAAAALRTRGVLEFLRERRAKLAIPLLAGVVLFMPAIKYLELRSGLDLSHSGLRVSAELQPSFRTVIPEDLPLAAPFEESFLEFLPTFFTDLDRFTWSHLWFLAYLLTLTLVLLPLFVGLLRRARGTWRPGPLWVYAPIAPLVLIQIALRPYFPGPYNLYNDWANLSFFATFLLAGFALALVPALEERIRSERRRALGVALAAALLLLGAVVGVVSSAPLVLSAVGVAGWCFVVALLGFARERFTRSSPALDYLVESAFPIYLLHQAAIVFLGYAIVQLPLGIAPKFALLLSGSVALTLAVYHFAVRPSGPIRLLAGMKPLRARRPAPSPQVAAAAGRS